MSFKSKALAGAMFPARASAPPPMIPKAVASPPMSKPASPLPEHVQAQQGFKAASKTHRGRRSKGLGAKTHLAQGQTHIANAANAPTPAASLGHLFKAVRSMHAAKQASAPPASAPADTDTDGM